VADLLARRSEPPRDDLLAAGYTLLVLAVIKRVFL